MAENPFPDEIPTEKKASKFPRWLLLSVPILLAGVCCIGFAVIAKPFIRMNVDGGGYSVESVILSTGLEDGQPIGIKDVFMPSDTIICTVKTTGWDSGIIGMRWYAGQNKIYEATGKTQDNTISTYIQSNKSVVIPEGKYRVEIFITEETLETVYFEVKIYHPTVNPSIPIPEGHRNIDVPWYPEVPFAFDEVWKINGNEWKINEVKVVVLDEAEEYFVAVVVDTDMKDILSLSEEEAKARTRDVALYALENGYVETAKGLEIDGKHYDLEKSLFVVLKNPSNQLVYRIQFMMDELVSQNAS